MSWYNHYKDRVNDFGYFLHFMDKYGPFLDLVDEKIPYYMHGMGEFGCGIANTTKYFAQSDPNYAHYCYDNSWDMLKLARENVESVSYKGRFLHHDITKNLPPRRYDIIHSHGVLEHFNNTDIESIFYHQTKMTDAIVHYVPSSEYDEQSYGDERLMTPDQWREILSAFDVSVETFNDGLDLAIWWTNPQ